MIPTMFLRSVEMFNGLTEPELDQIKTICDQVDIDSGATFFEEKDNAEYLYTLTEGEVALTFTLPGRHDADQHTITTLGSGSTFGWSALVAPYQYTLTACCTVGHCKAIRIKRLELEQLMDENHTVGYKIMRNLTNVVGRRFLKWLEEVTRQMGQNSIDGW